MKCFFVFGLVFFVGVALSAAADPKNETPEPSFYDELLTEIRKQQKALEGKGLNELASKFMEQMKSVGTEFVDVMRQAMNASGTEHGRSDKDKNIVDAIADLIASETAKVRSKRDTDAAKNPDIADLISKFLAGAQKQTEETKQAETEEGDESVSEDEESTGESEPVSDEASAKSAPSDPASTRIGAAPVILIPGPPGKPGIPGLPGLPGKPGKIPNFRGLKAILTTRVAELLAFLAVVAVLMVLKFLGLLGLLLGLVLPLYGKLKKAGVLVPGENGHEGYGHEGYEQAGYAAPVPSYAPPQSPYGRFRRFAVPVDTQYSLHGLASRVLKAVESAKFE